jgi:hypothetical protein
LSSAEVPPVLPPLSSMVLVVVVVGLVAELVVVLVVLLEVAVFALRFVLVVLVVLGFDPLEPAFAFGSETLVVEVPLPQPASATATRSARAPAHGASRGSRRAVRALRSRYGVVVLMGCRRGRAGGDRSRDSR